jgi:hypothetical protein
MICFPAIHALLLIEKIASQIEAHYLHRMHVCMHSSWCEWYKTSVKRVIYAKKGWISMTRIIFKNTFMN